MPINSLSKRLQSLELQKENLEKEILHVKEQIEKQSPFSKVEKIKLFKELFIANTDAYAKYWINKDGSKKGYAPVTYTFQGSDYIKVSDTSIQRHLEGKDRIGTYAVKNQSMCSFLAIDLDKSSFIADARAIDKVVNTLELKAYYEISKSGNGIHIWLFFEHDVLARDARILGDMIITQAMDIADGIDMKSYDRLFPNQDFVPPDALGNLIALPLHFGSRRDNRTIFVDIETLVPYANQWDLLKNVQKIVPLKLSTLIREHASLLQESSLMPWEIKKESLLLPKAITMVLFDAIYIEKLHVSNSFLNLLKRMASFYNPEFYIRQTQRRSVYNIARIISSYTINERYVILPRGLYSQLDLFVKRNKIKVHLEDKRLHVKSTKFRLHLKLRLEQTATLKKLLKHDYGVLVAPPGFGKTAIAAAIIEKRAVSTLVLVHKTNLLEQWVKRLSEYFSIDIKEVGMIGKGKKRLTTTLDVVTIQSLKNRADLIENYTQLIIDESHHLPAVTFEHSIKQFKGKYVLGLSATPKRRDGMEALMYMQCGTVVDKIKLNRNIKHTLITISTEYETMYGNFSMILSELSEDEERNKLIVQEISKLENAHVLVLSERIEHLNILYHTLKAEGVSSLLLHGGLKAKEKKIALKKMNSAAIILSTSSYIGEGVDIEHLDTIVLTMPISYPERLIQYLGRVGRQSQQCRAIDFVDDKVAMLRSSFTRRMSGYKKMGYVLEEKHERRLF